jgi:hypothetical protein
MMLYAFERLYDVSAFRTLWVCVCVGRQRCNTRGCVTNNVDRTCACGCMWVCLFLCLSVPVFVCLCRCTHPPPTRAQTRQLARITQGEGGVLFQECWTAKHPVQLRGVNWTRNTVQELSFLCDKMGPKCLSLVCRHLLDAYEAW